MVNTIPRSLSEGNNTHTIPITLYLPETHQQISIDLKSKAFVGRSSNPNTENTAYVDLTTVQGYERGVSRRHLMLVYEPESDMIIAFDLDSQNGSTLNGQVMSSHTGYEITHGDELRLGTLHLRFYRSARVPFDNVEMLDPHAANEQNLGTTQGLRLPRPKPDIRTTLQTGALSFDDVADDE